MPPQPQKASRLSTEEEDWWNTLAAYPADHARKLVFADWLDEHDDSELAFAMRWCAGRGVTHCVDQGPEVRSANAAEPPCHLNGHYFLRATKTSNLGLLGLPEVTYWEFCGLRPPGRDDATKTQRFGHIDELYRHLSSVLYVMRNELAVEPKAGDSLAEHEHILKILRGETKLTYCCRAKIDESQVVKSGRNKNHGPRYCSRCRKFLFIV